MTARFARDPEALSALDVTRARALRVPPRGPLLKVTYFTYFFF